MRNKAIPSLEDVLDALPEDLHPQSVAGSVLTPQPVLVLHGERAFAKEWLEAGSPAKNVIELAEGLATGGRFLIAGQYPPNITDLRALGCETLALPAARVLWRIHFTTSAYIVPWNRLRTWGAVSGPRWEPHPPPPGDCEPLGAAYLGEDVRTCLAEVFQLTPFVDVDRTAPYLTAFSTSRDLVLADLAGRRLLKAGGSAQVALQGTERTRAWARTIHQAWARAIHQAWRDMDGLIAPSAMAGGRRVITLWNARTFPAAPGFSVPLNNPAILADILAATARIGYTGNIVL